MKEIFCAISVSSTIKYVTKGFQVKSFLSPKYLEICICIRAVVTPGPIFTFCPFYGVLCKIGPSNLKNDDYAIAVLQVEGQIFVYF